MHLLGDGTVENALGQEGEVGLLAVAEIVERRRARDSGASPSSTDCHEAPSRTTGVVTASRLTAE